MKLKEYLDKSKLGVYDFASVLKVTPNAVYNWIKGEIRPHRSIAKKIVKKTKQEVTMEDLGW